MVSEKHANQIIFECIHNQCLWHPMGDIALFLWQKTQCKGSMCFPFLLYKAIVRFHLAKHNTQSIKKSCCEYHVKLGKGFMCSNNAVLLRGNIRWYKKNISKLFKGRFPTKRKHCGAIKTLFYLSSIAAQWCKQWQDFTAGLSVCLTNVRVLGNLSENTHFGLPFGDISGVEITNLTFNKQEMDWKTIIKPKHNQK